MKAKKILALLLAAAMTFSLVACGDTAGNTEDSGTGSESTETESGSTEDNTEGNTNTDLVTGPVSIDFEDGLYGFVGVDKTVNPAGDDSVIELADYNGSKAVKVTPQGKDSFIRIQVDALLGENIANLKTIDIVLGTENPDGKFYSTSGNIYAFVGESNAKTYSAWSIYLENSNPKVVSYTLADGNAFVEGNYIVVSLEEDPGYDKGATQANFYIDDIVLKDASGNVLTADTSAEVVVADTGADRSNLCNLTGAVNFEGFALTGGGWGQNGIEMTTEILAALVPGAVVEIEFSSTSGDLWIVMPDASVGWSRVGQGNADGSGSDSAYINNSKSICQITYEQIAAVCGEDVSTWGARMQMEASGDWEVYSVKVGQKAPNYAVGNAVEAEGAAVSGGGWSQVGFEMSTDFVAALVPGAVVEIEFSSTSNDIWIVMPDASVGWSRVGVGNADGSGSIDALCVDGKCYVTYEQIASICGDDVSAWGTRMQFEADSDWEVYSCKVGTASEMKMIKNLVEAEGAAVSGGGWSQVGFEMSTDFIAALVPGAVVTISFSSEADDIWVVMPDASVGWSRVGVGNADGSGSVDAVCSNGVCQVTYEMLVAVCGEDVSTWGTRMQFESSVDWEVYSVAVGQSN